ncbi:hypothetical protein [Sporosalibacterium faouarense]|uniref:hypothetical protein n=1 Tax=Sporosalibacterium faouarense TaxID=516123 RepID=UPI00192B325C|nr:hypothetical protein [Sporosalibacterium faouarense]
MENTSGHGEYTSVPPGVSKWNWGAFWLTWIWGLANKSYIALLAFLPIVNIIIPFYLGAKGNELAWKNKTWYDIDDLHRTQRKWAIAGWVVAIFIISLIIINVTLEHREMKKTQEYTNEIIQAIENNEEATDFIGSDIKNVNSFNLSRRQPTIGARQESYTLLIQSNKGIFMVSGYFDDNRNIQRLKISEFGNESTNKIEINLE